jgi:uncharacterized protein
MDEPRVPAVAGREGSRTPDVSFIGRGISWPMHVDHTGGIALSQGVHDLDRSIRVVLSTAPNERVMRPRFGCRIWELLFEPVTPTLYAEIQQAVFDASPSRPSTWSRTPWTTHWSASRSATSSARRMTSATWSIRST